MTKKEILNILKEKHIISPNNKKHFCWNKYCDLEIEQIFNDYKQNYRTEDEAWFCLLNNVEPYHCEICGELAKFTGNKKSKTLGYNTTCKNHSPNQVKSKLEKFSQTINERTNEDRKKIIEKRKQTNLEKYGDENYTLFGSDKFKQTLKEKYGNEHFNNREKYKKTCLNRYGVSCNLLLNLLKRSKKIWNNKYEEIINKIKQTNLNKLGVEFVGQSKDVIDKIINKKKLNVLDIENIYNCTQQRKLFKKYGQGWKCLDLDKIVINGRKFISNEYIPLIEKYINEGCHTNSYTSIEEKELLNYIKSIYKYEILENVTNVISNNNYRYYELDIYLPKENIAFEFNGTYWHSTKYKDKYYHQRKTILCYNQNVQLIHIWENNWLNNKEQIKQQIKELLYGYDCSKYNWISLNDYQNYKLSEPEEIHINNLILFNEGKFIKKI